MVLGVPVLKHFRVSCPSIYAEYNSLSRIIAYFQKILFLAYIFAFYEIHSKIADFILQNVFALQALSLAS